MEDKNIILTGNPVSPGVKSGKILIYKEDESHVITQYAQPGEERNQESLFTNACKKAEEELLNLVTVFEKEDADKAKIFMAHYEILQDEEMQEEIRDGILNQNESADYAVASVFDQFTKLLGQVKDPLIAARTVDLQDVKKRLLRLIQGKTLHNLSKLDENVIIVARELLPSDTATIDRSHIMGIVTETGGATSHSAIIARCYRIPAVLGVQNATQLLQDGMMVVLDGTSGEVIMNPTQDILRKSDHKAEAFAKRQKMEEMYLTRPAKMLDDTKIDIGVNIGGSDLENIIFNSYDYIGLFRTEFLYMQRDHLPDEEEQFTVYKDVIENSGGKTVTLRTLDIGGDKTLPYIKLPKEENPFLGNRALRFCLTQPELFRTQLRAALRASVFGNLQIMFPMVGSIEDILHAKKQLELAKDELRKTKQSFDEEIRTGIMIEIPSIAMIPDLVAKEVDFASVGTNDLTQYLCAADRMNPDVSRYYQSLSPAMIRCLSFLSEAFHQQNKPLSVCGELAGDPKAAVILTGLGIRKLSMSEANIAPVKAILASLSSKDAQKMAEMCKNLKTETEVLDYLKSCLKSDRE